MKLTRRRALAGLLGVATVSLLAGCPGGQVEDCDEEDRVEGDPDCGDDVDGHKPKKPKSGTKPKSKR